MLVSFCVFAILFFMEIVVKQNEDGKWEGKLLVDGRIRCLAYSKDSEDEVHESLNLDWIQFARNGRR